MRVQLGQITVFLLLMNVVGLAREIAIVGGTVIDGTGRPPIPNATLVIGEDGKIRSVASGQPSPAGAEVVNAQGKYIIPGLWDMHVHYRGWMAEMYLHYGVTTIQSVGDPTDWILAQRDGVAKGKIRGPRIFACGDIIGAPERMRDTTYFRVVENSEEALEAARQVMGKGTDCLKVWTAITPEEAKAAAGVAHRAGKPVVGHVNFTAITAAEAGVDALAHISGVALSSMKDTALAEQIVQYRLGQLRGSPSPSLQTFLETVQDERQLMDPQKTKQVIQQLVDKGTFMEPDLVTMDSILKGGLPLDILNRWFQEDSLLYQNPNLQYIPERFRIRALRDLRRFDGLSSQDFKKLEAGYRNSEMFLKDYVAAGGKVVTGSDSSSVVPPGISIHRELQLLVRAGLTPLQAIQAGSYNCALFHKKENELGSLQPGRYADLILLDADPLVEINNTEKVLAVYKEGKLVDRSFHADYVTPIPEAYPPSDELHGNPIPRIRRISPMVATEGDAAVEITLTGTGFMVGSLASFDGRTVSTKVISPTEIRMTVPGELLTRAGTSQIIVTNPKPIAISDPLHEDERSNMRYFVVRFR